MTAGLVQDADLDTDTVARANTKLLLSCQAPRACSHLEGRPFLPPVGRVFKPYYKMQTRGEPPELNYPEVSRTCANLNNLFQVAALFQIMTYVLGHDQLCYRRLGF